MCDAGHIVKMRIRALSISMTTYTQLEASRKVGWAKYFAERGCSEEYRFILKLLCERVLYSNRLPDGDPLVELATEILKSL